MFRDTALYQGLTSIEVRERAEERDDRIEIRRETERGREKERERYRQAYIHTYRDNESLGSCYRPHHWNLVNASLYMSLLSH